MTHLLHPCLGALPAPSMSSPMRRVALPGGCLSRLPRRFSYGPMQRLAPSSQKPRVHAQSSSTGAIPTIELNSIKNSSNPSPTTNPSSPSQPSSTTPSSDQTLLSYEPPPPTKEPSWEMDPSNPALVPISVVLGLVAAAIAISALMALKYANFLGKDALYTAGVLVRMVGKSLAFRQMMTITAAMLTVHVCLKAFLSRAADSPSRWVFLLRELYRPLEILLAVGAICTMADSLLPSVLSVPRATVSAGIKSILSISFIVAASNVLLNMKTRLCKEHAWDAEMRGDASNQRQWDGYDRLGSFVIYGLALVLSVQEMGLQVQSVLAIGGVGGLAVGLAGRDIIENLFNGFLVMTTNPFAIGEEVCFTWNGQEVVGIIMDIGWYRTLVRSMEREIFVVPNAIFSKIIVLNITRKEREWRFFEILDIRLQDTRKVNPIVQDIRRIVRSDSRIIGRLHRRCFLDKVEMSSCKIYISFYLNASTKDAFMAAKHDFLLSFIDCIERNGAELAQPRYLVGIGNGAMQNAMDAWSQGGYGLSTLQGSMFQQAKVQERERALPSLPSSRKEKISSNMLPYKVQYRECSTDEDEYYTSLDSSR